MRSYQKATSYVCDRVEDRIDGSGNLYGFKSTFAEYVFGFSEVCGVNFIPREDAPDEVEVRGEGYFCVHPLVAPILVNLAELDEEFFDYCVRICSYSLGLGYPLEPSLSIFSSHVLQGSIKRPTRRSRPRNRNWTEKFRMWLLVHEVSQAYELTVTRNDEKSGNCSACDAVAEGLTICGRDTKYSEVKNLMVHPDYARIRLECETAFDIGQRSDELVNSGILQGNEREIAIIDLLEANVLDIVRTFPSVDKDYTFDN